MAALRKTLPFYASKLSAANTQAFPGHSGPLRHPATNRKDQNVLSVISNTLMKHDTRGPGVSERRLSPIGLVKSAQGQGAW